MRAARGNAIVALFYPITQSHLHQPRGMHNWYVLSRQWIDNCLSGSAQRV